MLKLHTGILDLFTSKPFSGNAVALVLLSKPLSDALFTSIHSTQRPRLAIESRNLVLIDNNPQAVQAYQPTHEMLALVKPWVCLTPSTTGSSFFAMLMKLNSCY